MGRKDKLRREKQARQRKLETAAPVAATTTTITAQATPTTATTVVDEDHEFPKSESYVQAFQSLRENNYDTFQDLVFRGALVYGCIHSMVAIGRTHKEPHLNGTQIHFGQPWFLEGSIRGSSSCVTHLGGNYFKATPRCPSLVSYWMKMLNRIQEWSSGYDTTKMESTRKILKDEIVKNCAICAKEDTDTLTLRQCIGCSTYCYCSKECQRKHWVEQGHGGECRQLKILNKYHKPYAKEIRKAAIRGESHPALGKLRNKLGLTRPLEEYQQLRDLGTTDDGRCIDPFGYVTARDDGTVWIGSTPMNLLGPSATTTTTTATTTTVSTEGDPSSTL